MNIKPVKIVVPATTANLGPGFDCLGMALELWNIVDVQPASESRQSRVLVQGEGAGELPHDQTNLVYRAMESLWRHTGKLMPPLEIRCNNQIPLQRGLGSSAAAIVGGLVAANNALDKPLDDNTLLELAVELEGHADNVSAALLGGLRLVGMEEGQRFTIPITIPSDIGVVLFVPEMAIATEEARSILPNTVSREDAVYNVTRVAMLINALVTGRMEDLRHGTKDRLHQPYRQKLFPGMNGIFAAALVGGALGVFLSGSGSSIVALTQGREMTLAYEMAEAARRAGVEGLVRITKPTAQGAHTG